MVNPTNARIDMETLYLLADNQYRTMVENGTWIVSHKKRVGAFEAQAGNADKLGGLEKPKPKGSVTPPWKTPPGPNEPHTRQFKGRPEYWCGKCGWNRTHLEAGHKTRQELHEMRLNTDASVNQAQVPDDATVQSNNTTPSAITTSTPEAAANASFLQQGFRG